MKTDIRKLNILRDSFVSRREHKIFLLEEGEGLSEEDKIILSNEINELTEKINTIDSKLSPRKT